MYRMYTASCPSFGGSTCLCFLFFHSSLHTKSVAIIRSSSLSPAKKRRIGEPPRLRPPTSATAALPEKNSKHLRLNVHQVFEASSLQFPSSLRSILASIPIKSQAVDAFMRPLLLETICDASPQCGTSKNDKDCGASNI